MGHLMKRAQKCEAEYSGIGVQPVRLRFSKPNQLSGRYGDTLTKLFRRTI